MTKRLLLFIVMFALAPFLFTGCLQIDIETGIDEVYNSYLTYGISMDVTEVDAQYHEILENAVKSLAWLYQENNGFSVNLMSTDTDIYTLKMSKAVQNDSFPEAFETLKAMLTDESITPFSTVDMSQISLPRQDSYTISAVLDIAQMLRLSSAGELPRDLQAQFAKALETSGGTIRLTLPLSELDGCSHDVEYRYNHAVMAVPVDFVSQTEFGLRGGIFYSESGGQIGTLDETVQGLGQIRAIVLISCGSILALLLIILLVVLLRKRKYDW